MDNPEKPVTSFVVNRAQEPTTWAGLAQIAVGIFVAVSVGDMAGVGAGAVSLVTGLISIFAKQRK